MKLIENKSDKVKTGQFWLRVRTDGGAPECVIVTGIFDHHVYFTYLEDEFRSTRLTSDFLIYFKPKTSGNTIWNNLNDR